MNVSLFTSTNPPVLTKSFSLTEQGELIKTSGGNLYEGEAKTITLPSLSGFAELLKTLEPSQALAYGICNRERANIKPQGHTDVKAGNAIARTKEAFKYPQGNGIMMFDYDPPKDNDSQALSQDDVVSLLREVISNFDQVGHVWWCSAGSRIYQGDNELIGLSGQRVYIVVEDARDIERASKVIQGKLWLAGHGYMAVFVDGRMDARTPFDKVIYQSNRLDFAAGASCAEGLEQRRGDPVTYEGGLLNTREALPDLTDDESKQHEQLINEARQTMQPKANQVRELRIDDKVNESVGISASPEQRERARTTIIKALDNSDLTGDFSLTVVANNQRHMLTIADVLRNPNQYDHAKTLDPIEPEYDGYKVCGILYLKGDKPMLHSQAHGGRTYYLHEHVDINLDDFVKNTLEKTSNETQKGSVSSMVFLPDVVDNLSSTDWIIRGYLPAKSTILLHAEPKIGKTFLAIDWAMSIATGKAWHGNRVDNGGGVLYISGEGNTAILKRFKGWLLHHNINKDEAKVILTTRAYTLPTDTEDIVGDVLGMVDAHSLNHISAIFFDTYRRTLNGDENSNVDAGAYIQASDKIREQLNCSVVIVHHSNRGTDPTRITGASALPASADVQLWLAGVVNSGAMKLVPQLYKDTEMPQSLKFRLEPVKLEGVYKDPEIPLSGWETTVVPIRDDDLVIEVKTTHTKNDEAKAPTQAAALRVLDRLMLSCKPDDLRVTYSSWMKECIDEGIVDKPFRFKANIVKRLISKGKIWCDKNMVYVSRVEDNSTTQLTNST